MNHPELRELERRLRSLEERLGGPGDSGELAELRRELFERLEESRHTLRLQVAAQVHRVEQELGRAREELSSLTRRFATEAELQSLRRQLLARLDEVGQFSWAEMAGTAQRLRADLSRLREELDAMPSRTIGEPELERLKGELEERLEETRGSLEVRAERAHHRLSQELDRLRRELENLPAQLKEFRYGLWGEVHQALDAFASRLEEGERRVDELQEEMRTRHQEVNLQALRSLGRRLDSLEKEWEALQKAALEERLIRLDRDLAEHRERVRELFGELSEEHQAQVEGLDSRLHAFLHDLALQGEQIRLLAETGKADPLPEGARSELRQLWEGWEKRLRGLEEGVASLQEGLRRQADLLEERAARLQRLEEGAETLKVTLEAQVGHAGERLGESLEELRREIREHRRPLRELEEQLRSQAEKVEAQRRRVDRLLKQYQNLGARLRAGQERHESLAGRVEALEQGARQGEAWKGRLEEMAGRLGEQAALLDSLSGEMEALREELSRDREELSWADRAAARRLEELEERAEEVGESLGALQEQGDRLEGALEECHRRLRELAVRLEQEEQGRESLERGLGALREELEPARIQEGLKAVEGLLGLGGELEALQGALARQRERLETLEKGLGERLEAVERRTVAVRRLEDRLSMLRERLAEVTRALEGPAPRA